MSEVGAVVRQVLLRLRSRLANEDGVVMVEGVISIILLLVACLVFVQLILYVHTAHVVKTAAADAARRYALTGSVQRAQAAAEANHGQALGIVHWSGVEVGYPECPSGWACARVTASIPPLVPGAGLFTGGTPMAPVIVAETGVYPLGGAR